LELDADGRSINYRALFEYEYGPVLPPGYHVHHRCENKACCEIAHLWPFEAAGHSRHHAERRRAVKSGGYALRSTWA
jgi:hypothetical protein